MKDHRLIYDKMQENADMVYENQWKKVSTIIIALALAAICYISAYAFFTTAVELTLPLALFGSFFPLIGSYIYDERNDSICEAEKRNQHLEKIRKNGISKSNELDRKRTNQIANIEDKKDSLLGKINAYAAIASIGSISWIGGSIATLFFHPAMWAALGGILVTSFGLHGVLKNERKYKKYETRIANLENDLLLGPIYGVEPVNKTSYEKSISSEHSRKQKAIANPAYESMVDELMKQLEIIEDEYHPNQKIKK